MLSCSCCQPIVSLSLNPSCAFRPHPKTREAAAFGRDAELHEQPQRIVHHGHGNLATSRTSSQPQREPIQRGHWYLIPSLPGHLHKHTGPPEQACGQYEHQQQIEHLSKQPFSGQQLPSYEPSRGVSLGYSRKLLGPTSLPSCFQRQQMPGLIGGQ